MAMGGVLGSVGQKVIAKQAAQVTRSFSESLERAITGADLTASAFADGVAPGDAGTQPVSGSASRPPRPPPTGVPADGMFEGQALAGLRLGFGVGVGFGLGVGTAALLAITIRRIARL